MIPRAWISRLALALVAAVSASGCVIVDGAAAGRGCGGADGPVTVYSVAPPMTAAWWVVVPIGADEGAVGYVPGGETIVEEPTDEIPEGTDPAEEPDQAPPDTTDVPPDPPPSDGSDGSFPESLRPLDVAYDGRGCFICSVICRTSQPGPSQPRAVSTASGVSATSQAAACADAERRLQRYASQSYSLGLVACGVIPN